MTELEAIRERHRKCESCYSYGELAHCDYCTTGMVRPYPCDTAVALAEIERLRGVVADAEQAKRAVLKWANSCHHVGCECGNTLADELPDDWMALAALEEGE